MYFALQVIAILELAMNNGIYHCSDQSPPPPPPPQFVPNEDFNQILLKCVQEISQHLRVALAPPNNPHIGMMRSLLESTMQLRIAQNYANVVMLLQKVSLFVVMWCVCTCVCGVCVCVCVCVSGEILSEYNWVGQNVVTR